jgi:tetratricopeptide (TPR) repeat protein
VTFALAGLLRSTAVVALIASMLPLAAPAAAQGPGAQAPGQTSVQTMPVPTPEAEQLAAAMRRVGANPRDLEALLTAGELSLRVGDQSGAAALFKRAEALDPMNGRVKAGMARILVTLERPGEALRFFDQAIGYGLTPAVFAGDRGLAYDLIGQQERAQRDYRLALKSADTDEVRRRYALSLGISGRREQALEQIETLVRRNDRGAWRVRSFILAMTGDVTGANAIAVGMMPPGMAQGLRGFFARLATLSPADRAFAVHFGEVSPTPERLADARLVPALPPLGPDPDAPVAVAQVATPAPAPERRGRDRRRRRERVEVARADTRRPAPPAAATADPARRTPQPGFDDSLQRMTLADQARRARERAMVERATAPSPVPTSPAPNPVQVASVPTPPPPAPVRQPEASLPASTPAPAPAPALAQTEAAPAPVPPTPPSGPSSAPVGASAAVTAATPPPIGATTPAEVAQSAPSPAPVASPPATPAQVAQTPPAPQPAPEGNTPPAQVAAAEPAIPASSSSATPVSPRMSEDSILARIVAGIAIPGYELGVGAPPAPPPQPQAQPTPAAAPIMAAPSEVVQAVPSEPEPAAEAPKPKPAVAEKPAEKPVEVASAPKRKPAAKPEPAEAEKPDPKKPDPKSRTAKADPKAKPDAKGDPDASAAKADPKAKPEAKGKGARGKAERAKAEPKDEPRIWVQVAGGAYEGDLPKAWAAVKSKTPALAKREGYSTPLRATNRVVTGPFKTEAEAQALVNQLSKQGVSAFTFTSAAGQKVTRLPSK